MSIRIAAVSTEDLLQVLPLSHPSLSITWMGPNPWDGAEPRDELRDGAELRDELRMGLNPRDGAAGSFPCPTAHTAPPESIACFSPYSSAVGRLRISNIHLPWSEGAAVGFSNSFMFSFSSAEGKYLLGSIS